MTLLGTAAFACLAQAISVPAQDPEAPRVERADQLAHYQRVERELRAAAPPRDPALAAARVAVLDLLAEYRSRGEFGHNTHHPGTRQPCFVDDAGRRCAVAFLLDRTGAGELTLQVAATANHAWVADLAGSAALRQWLAAHGLTLAEAARIQAPGWVPPPLLPPSPPPPPPRWSGPGEAAGTSSRGGGTRPAAAAGSGAAGAAAPRGVPAGTAVGVTPGAARAGVPVVDLDAETFLPWFELQATRWLLAVPLPKRTSGTSGDHARARADFVCRAQLADADSFVRAAAAISLGRLGAADAAVRELLADPVYEVRCAAIAALASTGTAAAVHALLSLATNERTPALRPLALAALGAAGHRDLAVENVVAALLARCSEPELLAGAAAYVRLGGAGAALPDVCARLRGSGQDNATVRALLALGLPGAADAATVAALTQAASGSGLDLRRAAAAALGRSREPLALPALQTAFELEHDLGTAAQLLLSIGEQGGAAAQAFLVEQLASGRKPLRSWAAVALGILGRDRDDAALVAIVREGQRSERNRDQVGLWLLALGLLRDGGSSELLGEQALRGSGALVRAAALWALALLEQPGAEAVLQCSLETDDCEVVRAVAADVLALRAGPRATAALRAAIDSDRSPAARAAAAFALGATQDPAATALLCELAAPKAASPMVRAAALRGLGRLLAQDPRPRFAPLGWSGPGAVPPVFAWLARLDR